MIVPRAHLYFTSSPITANECWTIAIASLEPRSEPSSIALCTIVLNSSKLIVPDPSVSISDTIALISCSVAETPRLCRISFNSPPSISPEPSSSYLLKMSCRLASKSSRLDRLCILVFGSLPDGFRSFP